MSRKDKNRAKAAIAVIEEQQDKLKRLYDEYHTAYDAVFEAHNAHASVQRWVDRTFKLMKEHVSQAEATTFQRTWSSAERERGLGRIVRVSRHLPHPVDRGYRGSL